MLFSRPDNLKLTQQKSTRICLPSSRPPSPTLGRGALQPALPVSAVGTSSALHLQPPRQRLSTQGSASRSVGAQ